MTAPRRLLLTADAVGGVWTYALELAAALRPFGWETVLAVLGPSPSAEQRAAADTVATVIDTGLPLDWLAEGPAPVAAASDALAELARGQAVDLVQLNGPALAAAGEWPVPVVAVAHSDLTTWWAAVERGPLPDHLRWQADLFARGLARADAAVAPSFAYAMQLEFTGAAAAPPTVIVNGRTPPPLASNPPVPAAFTAGRLWDRGKDVATLDRAAARLDLTFAAAGPTAGPDGSAIALDHLEALGTIDAAALAARLAARPVFASAARYEPFGLAVLEAAQAGCALVLADTPVFRELWGKAALLVPPGDDEAFARAIAVLLADPRQRAALGERAATIGRRFTPERTAQGMAILFDRVLGAEPRR